MGLKVPSILEVLSPINVLYWDEEGEERGKITVYSFSHN